MKKSFLIIILSCYGYALIGQEINEGYLEPKYRFILTLEYTKSIDSVNQLIRLNPSDNKLYYYRALSHYLNGQIGNAYNDASLYLKQVSGAKSYYGFILMGKIHLSRLTPMLSFDAFENAIIINPVKVDAYLEKSKAFTHTRDFEIGLEFTDKCIKRFPSEPKFWFYRGMLLLQSNNIRKALLSFEYFLNTTPNQTLEYVAEAYLESARCHLINKDYQNAMSRVNNGLQSNPNLFYGYGIRGEIYFNLKDYDNALSDFNKMELHIQRSYYWTMIAKSYENKGDIEAACSYYSKRLSLFPQDGETRSKLKRLKCKKAD